MKETDILRKIIETEFPTKQNFCETLGMTSQNLNHILRKADAEDGKLPYHLKSKLWVKNITSFAKEIAKLEGDKTPKASNEPKAPYGTDIVALNKIIEMQDEKIIQLERELQKSKQS